jgi:predicted Zn-dependent protease
MFGSASVGETDRNGYMAAISGLAFGDSPAQGSIVGNRFIHSGSKFTFAVPSGYSLQTAQSAVVGVAGDGEAVRFDSADVQPNMALTDYLKSGWIAGLKAGTVTSHSYNGIEMASGVAQTDQWFFRVAVMRLDGAVYRFIFAAKADSPRFAAGAEATIQSFRRAEAADLNQIRKLSMRVVTAKAGDTADTMARQMANIPGGRELFYILNNLYPGDPVKVGEKYKIVGPN